MATDDETKRFSNAVVVCYGDVTNPHTGASIRTRSVVAGLRAAGLQVTVAVRDRFVGPDSIPGSLAGSDQSEVLRQSSWAAAIRETASAGGLKPFQAAVGATLHRSSSDIKFDIAVTDMGGAWPAVGLFAPRQRILNLCDIDSEYAAASATVAASRPQRAMHEANSSLWARYERASAHAADLVVVPSEVDRATVLSWGVSQDRVASICSGLPDNLLGSPVPERHDPALVFVGSGHARNLDSLGLTIRHLLPLLPRGTGLRIAGNVPQSARDDLTKLAAQYGVQDQVSFLGRLPSLDSFFTTGTILAAPFSVGAGTKIKVAEALTRGIPCVGNSHTFRGIPIIKDSSGSLSTESWEEMAQFIAKLHDSPARWNTASSEVQTFAERNLTWTASSKQWCDAISRLGVGRDSDAH